MTDPNANPNPPAPSRPATAEEIAAAGFDIPGGQYKARGIEGSDQFGTNENNGNDEVSVDLTLVDLQRNVTSILYFSDRATPYSLDRLRLMGWEGGDTFAGISKNEVPVVVKYEVYDSKVRMKVEIVSSRFSFQSPMSDVQKRGFFARLNQIAAQQGSAPRAGAAPMGAPVTGYPPNWDGGGGADPNRPALKL